MGKKSLEAEARVCLLNVKMYGNTQRIFPEKPKYISTTISAGTTLPNSTCESEDHMQPAER